MLAAVRKNDGLTVCARVQTLQMTKLQSFRAVMTALGDSAAWAKGQALSFVPLEGDALPPPVGTAAHLRTTPCAMLDGTGWLNLLAGVPGPLWAHVQACARRTLIALSGAAAESGAACLPLFTRPARLTFDAEVTLHLGPTQAAVGLQDDLPAVQGCALKAERLLTRALTTRALSVLVLVPPPAPVALSAVELPGLSALPWLRIALLLDPKEVRRSPRASSVSDWVNKASEYRRIFNCSSFYQYPPPVYSTASGSLAGVPCAGPRAPCGLWRACQGVPRALGRPLRHAALSRRRHL